jgi:D-beta-D-heptose 7-phosphate kinase/D-beta-D-heptose 1-phosphate adenosyltransferase
MGKTVDRNVLKQAADNARIRGEKIVFTNGCFDILHVGHIRYLKAAKKLGDILVVGLNSDRSVAALKPGRPVNPEIFRAEVLAYLEMVDYVTVFDEETPYDLISLLQPDVLVKGGDWKREDIVGSDIVKDTRSLPYVRGVSTSGIITKIRKVPEHDT